LPLIYDLLTLLPFAVIVTVFTVTILLPLRHTLCVTCSLRFVVIAYTRVRLRFWLPLRDLHSPLRSRCCCCCTFTLCRYSRCAICTDVVCCVAAAVTFTFIALLQLLH